MSKILVDSILYAIDNKALAIDNKPLLFDNEPNYKTKNLFS